MDKIRFSLEEAQELIPKIKLDVIKLMKLSKNISILNTLEVKFDDSYSEQLYNIKFNKKYHKTSYDFFELLDKLYNQGCIVQDTDKGIINFYSLFGNREIVLCWKPSDEKIKYWHEVQIGYESKKPISMIKTGFENK